MQKKPGMIILIFVIAFLAGFFGYILITVYVDMNKEISLAKKAPRAVSPVMVSEYEYNPCWVTGTMKADNPEELLLSRGTKKPCVYYSFTLERAIYEQRTDGKLDKDWHVLEQKSECADIPLTVQGKEYHLRSENLIVRGGLVKTLDRKETKNHTEYRYSEYIIPDGALLWVLGIPDNRTITSTEKGLFITMQTPDAFIGESSSSAIVALVISSLLFCLAVFLILLGIHMIRK
jgi:hypothetical protein